jgi:glycosyltransferase involved in cell wall biosynthesis
MGNVKAQPGVIRHKPDLVEHVIGQKSHPLLGPRIELKEYLKGIKGRCVAHIHTCFSQFTESAMFECVKHGVPFVFTPHGKLSPLMFSNQRRVKKWYWDNKVKNFVNQAAEIVLSSPGEAALFKELNITRKWKAIPNGYDETAFLSSNVEVPLIKKPYILFLGYLEARKQPGFLIELFANSALKSTHKLIIAGPDTYGHKETLTRIVRSLGLEREVMFFGPAYKADKWNLMKYASCFCLPSKAEGLPVVLCEAIGAGVPVLYSTGCNFPELAQSGCGVELDGFDAATWREALERVCLNKTVNEQMKACAARIKSRYKWSSVCQEWLALYKACVS